MKFSRGLSVDIPELTEAEALGPGEFLILETGENVAGRWARVQHMRSRTTYRLKLVETPATKDTAWARRVEEGVARWIAVSPCSGVVTVYCAAWIDNTYAVCMPWIKGDNLRHVIRQRHPAAFFGTAIRVVRTLAWACRRHGIVHGSLHPESIVFDEMGLAYLADWGPPRRVVNRTDAAGDTRFSGQHLALTPTGQAANIITYASPEEIRGERVSDKSDIYSLGCILYEWETGRSAFAGDTGEAIAYRHLHQAPPRLGGLLHRSRFGLDHAIARCLAKEPGQRFANHEELLQVILDRAKAKGIDPAASGLVVTVDGKPVV